MPTARQVFEVIKHALAGRVDDVLRFALTGYSFEEWINWEAFAACARAGGWKVTPKPNYGKYGVEGSREYGDLLIEDRDGGPKVFVEFALAHSSTQDKWLDKINWDTEKLRRLANPSITAFQVLVLASNDEPILETDSWQRWLAKVQVWNEPTELTADRELSDTGRLVLRAWVL